MSSKINLEADEETMYFEKYVIYEDCKIFHAKRKKQSILEQVLQLMDLPSVLDIYAKTCL